MKRFTIILAALGLGRLAVGAPECCPDGDLFGTGAGGAEALALTELQMKNLGLRTAAAGEQEFESSMFALGHIEAIPKQQAAVSSRISGRVAVLAVNPGENVKKGEELLRIESRQAGNPPPVITLNAPIDGTICELDVRTGDPVEPDRRLMDVTDLRDVMAVAQVFEHQAGSLRPGMKARIRVPAFPDEVFPGELVRLGTEVNRDNGTIDAVFQIANPDLRLRPGMRAEFSILTDSRSNVLSIPREAVLGDVGNSFVYLADYEQAGVFHRTPVETGLRNDRRVEVISGLFPGDEVVTTGAYSLQFAGGASSSLKDAMDAAHGHAHGPNGEELDGEGEEVAGRGAEHDHEGGESSALASSSGEASIPLVAGGAALLAFALGVLIGRGTRKNA